MGLNVADKQNKQRIYTNTPTAITIRGADRWKSEGGGVQTLGLYANVHLPKDNTKRKQLARGGWTAYFQQLQSSGWDQTGLIGPVPVSRFAGPSLLICHTWKHGVNPDRPWQFMVMVEAYNAKGQKVKFALDIGTRNVRID